MQPSSCGALATIQLLITIARTGRSWSRGPADFSRGLRAPHRCRVGTSVHARGPFNRDLVVHPRLSFQRPPYDAEVVIAMPHGVVLEQELTREGRIEVEGYRRGLRELLVAERPDCGRR